MTQHQPSFRHRRAPHRVAPLAACVAVALIFTHSVAAQQDLQFILSFADASGKPLTDISSAELVMTENGADGTILQMEPIGRALDVSLIIDNGIGMGPALAELRTAARGFFAGLPEEAQMSLITIAPQPRWVQRPTVERRDVLKAVDRLTADESLGRYLDALVEYGDRLARLSETRHGIVVAIGTNAPDGSTSLEQHFRRLAQRIVDHSATVHSAIISTNARLTGGRLPPGGVSSNLQHLVGFELSRISRGRYEQIAVTSRLVSLLPELAADITAASRPYRVKVRRPAGAKGNVGPIAFGIGRTGISIRAAFANVPATVAPLGR